MTDFGKIMSGARLAVPHKCQTSSKAVLALLIRELWESFWKNGLAGRYSLLGVVSETASLFVCCRLTFNWGSENFHRRCSYASPVNLVTMAGFGRRSMCMMYPAK